MKYYMALYGLSDFSNTLLLQLTNHLIINCKYNTILKLSTIKYIMLYAKS